MKKLMVKLYNTLTRQVQDFKPININQVSLYSCGPTVYDYAHIGNLRSFVFDDSLRRVLEASGYHVKQVMNITDVGHLVSDADEGNDKLESGAKRDGKSVWEVAEHFTEAFKNDMAALNILPPNTYSGEHDNYARATDFIEQQIEIIKLLIDKNFAYQTTQAIYFDVSKLADYGELTGQKLSAKATGARAEVITDSEKRNPQDFAVWFFTVGRFADHTMHWVSPWGEGFPGWHLECSAIIHATLGDPIDIHTGGVDHIGTHHTNEMAQTEAAYKHKLANYWLHNEFLVVDGQKMAKSKGNFVTLAIVKNKGFDPLALRLLFLQSHYRSQMNFTWESLVVAQKNLTTLRAFADLRFQLNRSGQPLIDGYFTKTQASLLSEAQNDLATPGLLAKLNEVINHIESTGQVVPKVQQSSFLDFLSFLDQLLGLKLLNSKDISLTQSKLILERESCRQNQKWDEADRLRLQLVKQGLIINDTDNGPIWSRTGILA